MDELARTRTMCVVVNEIMGQSEGSETSDCSYGGPNHQFGFRGFMGMSTVRFLISASLLIGGGRGRRFLYGVGKGDMKKGSAHKGLKPSHTRLG